MIASAPHHPPASQAPLAAKRSKQAPLLSAFISHAKADEKKARAIADGLESRGFKCWIAPRDVRAGRSYGDEIIGGIESTRSFVLVLSKASNDSAFVAREVERAVSKKKPIFAVRIANIEPAPSLELFISGTQWIDAFPGRLAAHVDRLVNMLADEEGRDIPAPSDARPASRNLPKWAMPLGAAAAVLLVLGAGIAFWPAQNRIPEDPDRSLIVDPAWRGEAFNTERAEVASANPGGGLTAPTVTVEAAGDTEMIIGGKPDTAQMARAESDNDTEMIVSGNPLSPLAAGDPDFRACEKSSGDDGIAACDRAIASGKFTGRSLSYIYSDRGLMRMQTGAIERALADLNEAARIDSGNFYAFWNRGAVYAAKKEFDRAQEDFATALALKPDKTSKAKIEEALNAVTEGARAANAEPSDPSVITDPSVFMNPEGQAAASSQAGGGFAAEMPTLGLPPAAVMPASPPLKSRPFEAQPNN